MNAEEYATRIEQADVSDLWLDEAGVEAMRHTIAFAVLLFNITSWSEWCSEFPTSLSLVRSTGFRNALSTHVDPHWQDAAEKFALSHEDQITSTLLSRAEGAHAGVAMRL